MTDTPQPDADAERKRAAPFVRGLCPNDFGAGSCDYPECRDSMCEWWVKGDAFAAQLGVFLDSLHKKNAPPQSDIERAREAWRPIRERLSGLAKSLQYPIKCLDHVTDERVKPHLLARSEASAALDGIVITEPIWLAAALSAARAESEGERQQLQRDLENALLTLSQVTKTASEYEFARGYARGVEDAEHVAFRVMSHGTFNQAVIQAIRALSLEPRKVKP